MRESDLQREILKALALRGYWAHRRNSGKILVEGGASRVVHLGEPGTPDIELLAPYGFLEVKTAKGKLSRGQERWHAKARSRGVRVAVVRSISEALDTAASWALADAEVNSLAKRRLAEESKANLGVR